MTHYVHINHKDFYYYLIHYFRVRIHVTSGQLLLGFVAVSYITRVSLVLDKPRLLQNAVVTCLQ